MNIQEILKLLGPHLPELMKHLPEGEALEAVKLLMQLLPEMADPNESVLTKIEDAAKKVLPLLASILPGTPVGAIATTVTIAMPLIDQLLSHVLEQKVKVVYEQSDDAHPPETV